MSTAGEQSVERPVRGVMFDCDGTLMDSMGVWRGVEDMLAGKAGQALTNEEKRMLGACTLHEAARYFHERYGLGSSVDEVTGWAVAHLEDFYAHKTRLRPGVEGLIGSLDELGIPMCVVSSTPERMLRLGFAHVGMLDRFQGYISASDLGMTKREPAIFDRALKLLGTPPAGTWGFEDSLYAVQTMKRVGLACVGIYDRDESGTFEDLEQAADVAFREFTDMDTRRFIAGVYAR